MLAITATFVFAAKARRHTRLFRAENEPIQAWMSVPFIAHSHHVPVSTLFEAIGVRATPRDRRSVRHLAHELKEPLPELIAKLQHAIDAAGHSPGSTPQ